MPSASDLLTWYDRHRRTLPWRAPPGETADPYRVWLSEIMLQQTTVTAVIPYYENFLRRFPDLKTLAAAPEHEVMQAWAGLGYYARARNLHAAARKLAEFNAFPNDLATLRSLPGIGAYTSAAIAAIAFNHPIIPVDGNVERVIARLHAITTPLPAARPAISAAAQTLAGPRPSDLAQALFDLGATICTPTNPSCPICPWQTKCAAHRQGIAATLPRKTPKKPRPTRHGAHFHLTDAAGNLLLRRRPPTGLLGGMTELPGTPWRETPWPQQEALTYAPMQADWQHAGKIRHIFTHFELHLDVYTATTPTITAEGTLHRPETLATEALPSVMQKCLTRSEAERRRERQRFPLEP